MVTYLRRDFANIEAESADESADEAPASLLAGEEDEDLPEKETPSPFPSKKHLSQQKAPKNYQKGIVGFMWSSLLSPPEEGKKK